MLTFESHPKEVQQMRDIINRNIYYGVLFIKADKSLRPLNGRKVKYVSQKKDGEARGIWNRKEHNILTVFDRNKQQRRSKCSKRLKNWVVELRNIHSLLHMW